MKVCMNTLILQDWGISPPGDGDKHSRPSRYYDITISSVETLYDRDRVYTGIHK
jgi:hypothetical protein